MLLKTEQEQFWAGEFGNEYIARNDSSRIIASNLAMFSRIFKSTHDVRSVIDFGSNIGLNLRAINDLLPEAKLAAIEINRHAIRILNSWDKLEIYHDSILEFRPEKHWEFVLIKCVLIHINPEYLARVYESLYRSSSRYICIAEYYNPFPVEVDYRGHSEKLFKRDYAGEMLDRYPDLSLVDYGFIYHRDNSFPQDDVTWFLMEKC